MKHKKHAHTEDLIGNPGIDAETPVEQAPAAIESGEKIAVATAENNYEELEQRLKLVESNAAEAESLYKRMAADFENYRKRIDRERQEFRGFGLQQAAEALFPALDDLDRAQASLSAQMRPEDLLESIKLVFNRIRQSAEQIGLRPIEAVGEHFDPQFHEPVQKIESSEFPDGAVMEVLRKGYTLNGKVIRPALVNVASAAQPEPESAESET